MKKINLLLTSLLILTCVSCKSQKDNSEPIISETEDNRDNDISTPDFTLPDITVGNVDYDLESDILIDLSNKNITNNNGYILFEDNTLYITQTGTYYLSGNLEGRIICTGNEETQIELILNGVSITSNTSSPLIAYGIDSFIIKAESGSVNTITDERSEEESYNSAIYSNCDTDIKGKGTLNVLGYLNNGIHSTKDLVIKNLNLNVTSINNSIKGNNSVTISSSTLYAISTSGDTIKTTDTSISNKGKQRGSVTITGGRVNLFAACDAIDSAYDVYINENVELNCYTEDYSPYSEYVSEVSKDILYLQIPSSCSVTLTFNLEDGRTNTVSGTKLSSQNGMQRPSSSNGVYYQFEVPSQVSSFIVNLSYSKKTYTSEILKLNDSYDCLTAQIRNSSLVTSWSTYQIVQGGGFGGPGGMMGGMQDGNTNKASYSCKGIKSKNEIYITGGNTTIYSHDDGLHATYGETLENESTGLGNIYITGGNLSITSDDDGIHADCNFEITGGYVHVLKSYEGIEANIITFNGGISEVYASDDGLNATKIKETPYIYFKLGTIYIDALGDGIDSNGNIVMSGGNVIAIGPSNGGNGVLDFDNKFTFSGGNLLCIGCSGMNQAPTGSGATVKTSKTSVSQGNYLKLSVDGTVTLELYVLKSNMNYIVYASKSSNISISNSSFSSFNSEIYGVLE